VASNDQADTALTLRATCYSNWPKVEAQEQQPERKSICNGQVPFLALPLMFCATISTSLSLFESAFSLNFCKIYWSIAHVFVPENGSVLRSLSRFTFSSSKNFAEMFAALNSSIQQAPDNDIRGTTCQWNTWRWCICAISLSLVGWQGPWHSAPRPRREHCQHPAAPDRIRLLEEMLSLLQYKTPLHHMVILSIFFSSGKYWLCPYCFL